MSSVEEHLATRRAAGLFDFSFMGLFEFSGTAALERLQSRRLSDIQPGRAVYTLLLNDDGSVFNDALIGADIVRGLHYFHTVELADMLIARLGYSGELGYELMVPAVQEPRLRSELLDLGRPEGLVECSFEAANTLRIECGYVLFDREIDGRANPRELGLDRLVSDRRRTFGMSRKLVGLEILGREAGADLPVARVTSECDSPTLGKRIALGFVAADASPGDLLRLDDSRPARVARLPFYDPDKRRTRVAPL